MLGATACDKSCRWQTSGPDSAGARSVRSLEPFTTNGRSGITASCTAEITEVRGLGTEVEVGDGVKSGDQVVLTPPVNPGDGERVRVRSPATAKAPAS